METSELRSVQTSLGKITYLFVRKAKKNMSAIVDRDGLLVVRGGWRFSYADADRYVIRIAPTLIRHFERAFKLKDFGDVVYLLGRPCRVYIEQGKGARTTVKYEEGEFIISRASSGLDPEVALKKWFRVCAGRELRRILGEESVRAEALYGEAPSSVIIRDARSTWGKCNYVNGSITLSSCLIHMPEECVRYVCCHELVHLTVPNHGKEFYARLGRLFPQYKAVTEKLDMKRPW